ncbi:MAG: multiple resistance and pH regulation protein F [Verrucomicrobia bacterium]|nr:multiple resistance and pH regulation protein F [Verrucomicrobiota bacterium]
MNQVYIAVALFLLGTILVGLLRVLRGPTSADRMLASQLFGTTGVAILLLMAEGLDRPDLRNVALIFALLGALAVVAFVKRPSMPLKVDDS